jgi:hypothetical protein
MFPQSIGDTASIFRVEDGNHMFRQSIGDTASIFRVGDGGSRLCSSEMFLLSTRLLSVISYKITI